MSGKRYCERIENREYEFSMEFEVIFLRGSTICLRVFAILQDAQLNLGGLQSLHKLSLTVFATPVCDLQAGCTQLRWSGSSGQTRSRFLTVVTSNCSM